MIIRNIQLLKLFNFFLDFRLYGPIGIIYFTQITNSLALGLMVFSISSISSSISEVPTGIISDMVGRKNTMLLGSISSMIGIAFYAFGTSFLLLAIGSFFVGVASSFFSGNNDSLLYETLKEKNKLENYSEYLGKLGSMFQVGLGVSSLIGGFLTLFFSFKIIMMISILPQSLCIIIALFIIEPKIIKHKKEHFFKHLKKSFEIFLKNGKLRAISIGSITSYGIGQTMHQFMPAFFALLLPFWAIGLIRFLEHLFATIGFWFSGKIIKILSPLKSLILSNIFNRIITILAVIKVTIFSPFLITISSLFFGIIKTSETTLMHKEFSDHQRATMSSINSLFGNIFFACFSYFFGMIADSIGKSYSILIGELLLIPLIIIYIGVFRKEKITQNKVSI